MRKYTPAQVRNYAIRPLQNEKHRGECVLVAPVTRKQRCCKFVEILDPGDLVEARINLRGLRHDQPVRFMRIVAFMRSTTSSGTIKEISFLRPYRPMETLLARTNP